MILGPVCDLVCDLARRGARMGLLRRVRVRVVPAGAMERASGKAGSASGAGRAEGAAWAGAGGRSLCNTCRGGGLIF